MKGLLYKDLILNRVSLIFYISLIILSGTSFLIFGDIIEDPDIYPLFALTIYGVLFISSSYLHDGCLTVDNKRSWSAFSISTPVLVKGCVLEKYFYIILISASAFAYSFFYEMICKAIGITDTLKYLKFNIICLFLTLIVGAINIPFVIRFGVKYGSYVKVAVMLIICAIAGIWYLFGDISMFGSYEKTMKWILDLLNGNNAKFICLLIILAVFSALILFVSYLISCGLYRKGRENCDK